MDVPLVPVGDCNGAESTQKGQQQYRGGWGWWRSSLGAPPLIQEASCDNRIVNMLICTRATATPVKTPSGTPGHHLPLLPPPPSFQLHLRGDFPMTWELSAVPSSLSSVTPVTLPSPRLFCCMQTALNLWSSRLHPSCGAGTMHSCT